MSFITILYRRLIKTLQWIHEFFLKNNFLLREEDKGVDPQVKLIVFLIFLTLMLDNMLLTVVVPIIPPILLKYEHGNPYNALKKSSSDTRTSTSQQVLSFSKIHDASSTFKPETVIISTYPRWKNGKRKKRSHDIGTHDHYNGSSTPNDYEEYYIEYVETSHSITTHATPFKTKSVARTFKNAVRKHDDNRLTLNKTDIFRSHVLDETTFSKTLYTHNNDINGKGDKHLDLNYNWSTSIRTSTSTTTPSAPFISTTKKYDIFESQYVDTEAPTIPEDIISENRRVGMLFASKALIQLVINPMVAELINRFGYGIPMCFGYIVLLTSSIIFAFGKSFNALLMARAIHGVSSACLNISGLALIAEKFPNDKQRSVYMARAMSGMAFGVFVGYPFGSVIYHFIGDSAPFWIISLITLIIGGFTVYVIKPVISPQVATITPNFVELLTDKYILVATGSILCSTTAIAVLEPSLPIWLMQKIHPAQWKLGIVFLPDSFGYLIGTNFFAKFAYNVGRWKCAVCSMITIAICLILIPFANHPAHLVLPHFGIGLGIGIIDSALVPYLGYIVDIRHSGMYGAVYSISQMAVCLAYGLGPSIGGATVNGIGFKWLVWNTAILNLAYVPLLWILKRIPTTSKDELLLESFSKDELGLKLAASNANYGRLQDSDDDDYKQKSPIFISTNDAFFGQSSMEQATNTRGNLI